MAVSQSLTCAAEYVPLTRPLITQIARRFELEYGAPKGYRRFWQYDHMMVSLYARWWLAPFLWAALDLSRFCDIRSIEMRLDAPEFLREWEGYPMKLPTFSWVMGKIEKRIEPMMMRRT